MRKLEEEDVEEAARIYAQGLLREKPPGSNLPLDQLAQDTQIHLRRALTQQQEGRRVWVALRRGRICGVLDFFHRTDHIRVRFICADPPREGVGTKLMAQLALYGVEKGVGEIRATVSPIDKRAINFYFRHLSFRQAGTEPGPGFALHLAVTSPRELHHRISKLLKPESEA